MELFRILSSHGVEYFVSGGVAFSVHARARYTADVDLVIRPTEANSSRFIRAFSEFGFSLKDHDPKQFLADRRLLRVGVEPSMIDVMNFFDGVAIEEVFRTLHVIRFDDQDLPFVSRENLILNKLSVGRPRDLADVEELRQTQRK